MGSSHSAPRRVSSRRFRRRSSDPPSSPSSNSFGGDYEQAAAAAAAAANNNAANGNATNLPQRWPTSEELPSLLEENGADNSQRSDPGDNSEHSSVHSIHEPLTNNSNSRTGKYTELSVIQSGQVLHQEDMNVFPSEEFSVPGIPEASEEFVISSSKPNEQTQVWTNQYPDGYRDDDSATMDYSVPTSMPVLDFYPHGSRNSEWMGRSIETLILGYSSPVPILCLPQDEDYQQNEDLSFWGPVRRRSTVSTLGSSAGAGGGNDNTASNSNRRGSLGSFPGSRRGSLVGSGNMHGGTLANYYSRRNRNEGSGHSRSGTIARAMRRGATGASASETERSSHSHTGVTRSNTMQRRGTGSSTTTSMLDGGSGHSSSGARREGSGHSRSGTRREESGHSRTGMSRTAQRSGTGSSAAPLQDGSGHSRNGGGGGGGGLTRSEHSATGGMSSRPMNRRGTGSSAPMNRRGSSSHGPAYRRRMSATPSNGVEASGNRGGPNVALSLIARQTTGKFITRNRMPPVKRLRKLGGHALFNNLDKPAGGMCSEVAFLNEVIDSGDWAETKTVVSRIAPRLIGDPAALAQEQMGGERETPIDDPNLPPTASRFYAGGGRLGLERDAFVQAGGIQVIIRVFREASFVGAEMARSYDARDVPEELVVSRLTLCWNEVMASLRELVYAIPSLVEDGDIFDNGEFLPFLFTLLSHDSCFDGAATLIEEIVSLQLNASPPPAPADDDVDMQLPGHYPTVRVSPPSTFFLGNVPDLYKLWRGFSCRQLAHFSRILALLIFEPEDRQLLESPAVLKSIELLQLRRNRAARAGRDSTIDLNQSILIGDETLAPRLLRLLSIMNYAPSIRRTTPYVVMARYPVIADTLIMLGLSELDQWKEVERVEKLARKMLDEDYEDENEDDNGGRNRHVNELGNVAEMMEELVGGLMGPQAATNQLARILMVLAQAQISRLIPGMPRDGSDGGLGENVLNPSDPGLMSEQMIGRRIMSLSPGNIGFDENGRSPVDENGQRHPASSRSRIQTPQDAANLLQLNAFLLGPFQVEVLFVLCTLLGGRRKIDTQELLKKHGIISVLDEMFHRLPWAAATASQQSNSEGDTGDSADEEDPYANALSGQGGECTPENALCVQYLRLLHNFCDRDCDNYAGRRLLLSQGERNHVFERGNPNDVSQLQPGLLSKITTALIGEVDESPYRFWLASCIESYLRGSSPAEQVFVAQSGLLKHLVKDITSDFLHCAGSLQTSFDLLGELCKGNSEVIHLLVKDLDEESFRKLMSVAAANLVDSNVFLRSLLLTMERMSASRRLMPLHLDPECFAMRQGTWKSQSGVDSRAYVTHSWWDTEVKEPSKTEEINGKAENLQTPTERKQDKARASDWFPSSAMITAYRMRPPGTIDPSLTGLHDGVGHFGWVFTPFGETLATATHEPNTVERLSWFLAANQTRLLRDLLGVVDLRNINHENICCLNTAVVIAIFASRRNELGNLLQDLGRLNIEERETKRRARNASSDDNVIDRAFAQALKYMDMDEKIAPAPYARRASVSRRASLTYYGTKGEIGDKNDVLRNFREVLWFWIEYYTHRGRDRLSLEYSSHLRFQEWVDVVSLLSADDSSPTSLVHQPVRLPRSPYGRSARVFDR
ncbi:unnamed protein product [Cylindrotheca closterium]|uniref:Uncharacterized protein n=1 Tax=Cylindrotheca closterium TaxID=2856 RepID=A0AAD2GCD6_9STRA|nr:unnamed protein product [Cylindrotheca closterium]